MLPLTPNTSSESQRQLWTSQGDDEASTHPTKLQSQAGPGIAHAPQSPKLFTSAASVAMFTHSVHTQANTVKFGHQAMCNPKISSLLKALWKGFLKGCPNLSEELVTKYLNPSPALAKEHMKCPKKGIRSTSKKSQFKGWQCTTRTHPSTSSYATNYATVYWRTPTLSRASIWRETGKCQHHPRRQINCECILFWCLCR